MNPTMIPAPQGNAKHTCHEVSVHYHHAGRTVYLHEIVRDDKPDAPFYFLIDFNGWPIDSQTVLADAIRQIKR